MDARFTIRSSVAAVALALGGLGAGSLLGATPAAAAGTQVCGDRAEILARLEQRHRETRQALGLSADGGVVEVLVSPQGGWTILLTYPDKPTCVMAVGEAWQGLVLTGERA